MRLRAVQMQAVSTRQVARFFGPLATSGGSHSFRKLNIVMILQSDLRCCIPCEQSLVCQKNLHGFHSGTCLTCSSPVLETRATFLVKFQVPFPVYSCDGASYEGAGLAESV